MAPTLRRLRTVGVAVVLLVGDGCRREVPANAPAFADDLPGRTAVVAWNQHGEALPEEWADAIADRAAAFHCRLQEGPRWSALVVPDDVAVGWPSLARSHTFTAALEEIPAEADTKVFIDLEQVVEALSRLDLPAPLGSVGERAIRAFDLRALRFAALGVQTREDGTLVATGTIVTSGVRTGLPGLLTKPVVDVPLPPLADGEGITVDASFAPGVLAQVFESMLMVDERTSLFEGMMAGPLRIVAEAVGSLGGRVHVEARAMGDLVAGITVRDEEGLREQLAKLPTGGGGEGGSGMRPSLPWHIENGWLVVSPKGETFTPPNEGERVAGPFVRVRFALAGGEGVLMLQRASDDAVRVRFDGRLAR